MTSTAPDGGYAQIPIHFADPSPRSRFVDYDYTGIWSCRFSADGNEIIAGGNKKIFGNFLYILARLTAKAMSSLRPFSQQTIS